MKECEDCGDECKRRVRCEICGQLVCGWCRHHVHNKFVQGHAAADKQSANRKDGEA